LLLIAFTSIDASNSLQAAMKPANQLGHQPKLAAIAVQQTGAAYHGARALLPSSTAASKKMQPCQQALPVYAGRGGGDAQKADFDGNLRLAAPN